MINSQYFEIPDFCATQTRQCDDCSNIFSSTCAANLGLGCDPVTLPSCTCHDICVEEVRLIGTVDGDCEFTECITYPPIGRCRLGPNVTFPTITANTNAKVFVVCAQEVLNDNCQVIDVKIRLLILAPTTGNNGNVLIPLDINVSFNTFFRFPNCITPISGNDLQQELTQIDGSCLVIQLRARTGPVVNGTTQIIISGKIVDKLWKHENLWVTGIRPYDLNQAQRDQGFVSFTIPDIFNNSHQIGDCGPIACPIPTP